MAHARARLALLGAALLAGLPLAEACEAIDPVAALPVMVGGQEDMDACMSLGYVDHLNPKGDNFLSVRAQPRAGAPETYRVKAGHMLWLCDESRDGKWYGVVFQPAERMEDWADCNVSTPLPRGPYRGPCRSGWVAKRFVELAAG
ncbi:MAG: integron [Sphingomonadales bacterium]|nr:integron [Sphingomonadales bacterium]MBD3772877.1 integron [Paracoccaceae bacterium]